MGFDINLFLVVSFIALFYIFFLSVIIWIGYQIFHITKRNTSSSLEYYKGVIAGIFGGILTYILLDFNNKVIAIPEDGIVNQISYLLPNLFLFALLFFLFFLFGLIYHLVTEKLLKG